MDKKPLKKEELMAQEKPQEIGVVTPQEISKGVYSNVAIIRHTQNEFLIDFLFQIDGMTQLVSRVIMSPSHMRLFKDAIEKNIAIFDEKKTQH